MSKPDYDTHFPDKIGSYQQDKCIKAINYCITRECAVDIGAHVGHWAHTLKKYFKDVHCFEPVPDNYVCLVKNVPGCNYYPVALLDKPGRFNLHLDSGTNSGSWTAFPEAEKPAKTITVKTRTLDSFGLKPDFIKMDIQNCELFVLKGAIQTITENKPVLCIESMTNQFRKEIHDFLKNIDYCKIDGAGKEEIFIKK